MGEATQNHQLSSLTSLNHVTVGPQAAVMKRSPFGSVPDLIGSWFMVHQGYIFH